MLDSLTRRAPDRSGSAIPARGGRRSMAAPGSSNDFRPRRALPRFGRAVLDPAADDTVFPLDTAARLGIPLRPSTGHGVRSRGQLHPPRFGDATLLLTDNVSVWRWPAVVGFSPAPIRYPILGQAGCLQFSDARFLGADLMIELDTNRTVSRHANLTGKRETRIWTRGMPEAASPALRSYTLPAHEHRRHAAGERHALERAPAALRPQVLTANRRRRVQIEHRQRTDIARQQAAPFLRADTD